MVRLMLTLAPIACVLVNILFDMIKLGLMICIVCVCVCVFYYMIYDCAFLYIQASISVSEAVSFDVVL